METRPIKELLIILRDNLTKFIPLNSDGLCNVTIYLKERGIITEPEWFELRGYLYVHKPKLRAWIRRKLCKEDSRLYWWTPGYIKSRLKWLNKQINKL